jgi:membrane-anchored glycerophosphoryl diester phosphodiesterase (GDPDase)
MGTWSDSWRITRTALWMIREDPALLALPAIAGLSLLGILALFLVPVFFLGAAGALFGVAASQAAEVTAAILLVTMYFVLVFVGNLFTGALIGMASMKLDGEQPTVADGLRFASARWKGLLLWSLIAATVGLLIRLVASRLRGVEGILVQAIAGGTWALATYFVVPVIVFEGQTGFKALRRSWTIFRDSFGRTIVTNLVVGVITLLLVLAGVGLFVVGLLLAFGGHVAIGATLIFTGVALFVFAAVLGSALEGIVRASLYRYAVTGKVATGLVAQPYVIARGSAPPPPPPDFGVPLHSHP